MVSSSSSMSSRSRRSTRSTASSSPPAWRSGSTPKLTAQASLSYVIAEPQQGSPLASATSRLPSPAPRSQREPNSQNLSPTAALLSDPADMDEGIAGIFETTPIAVEQSQHQQSGQPGPSSMPLSSEASTETAISGHSSAESASNSPQQTAKIEVHPKPTPSVSSDSESKRSVKSTVRKVSWFSSLTRGKSRRKESKPPAIPFPSAEQPVEENIQQPLPRIEDRAPTPTSPEALSAEPAQQAQGTGLPVITKALESEVPHVATPPSSPPRDIPLPQSPTKRSWFSSTPKTNVQSATPVVSAPSSIPSSLDEVVPPISKQIQPPPPPSSPAVLPSPSAHGENGAPRQRLSSLNPSTSRFVLSVPLLGRRQSNPSMSPENSEIANGPREGTSGSQAPNNEVPPPSDIVQSGEAKAQAPGGPINQPVPPEAAVSLASNNNEPPPAPLNASTSWLTYLGWNTRPSSAPPSVVGGNAGPSDALKASPMPPQLLTSDSAPTIGPATRDQNPVSPVAQASHGSSDVPSPARLNPSEPGQQLGNSIPSRDPACQPKVGVDDHSPPVREGDAKDVSDKDSTEKGAAGSANAEGQGALIPSSSTWYNPWTWYPPQSGNTSDVEPQTAVDAETPGAIAHPTSEETHPTKLKGRNGTEAPTLNPSKDTAGSTSDDRKKDFDATGDGESLSPKQAAGASLPSDHPSQRQSSVDNPIAQTVGANRSAWASFFSSKSLLVKTITGAPEVNRDENGMEVMDIDDEDDAEKPPVDTNTNDNNQRGRDDKAKKEVGSAQNGVQVPPSKSENPSTVPVNIPSGHPSPKKPASDKKASEVPSPRRKPVAPPLTVSDSIKRETIKQDPANPKKAPAKQVETTKSSSPARSTKSARSSRPRSPPPPNLVLPTWQDTFHTAPRNYIPPPPVSKFTKTMQFVSGVLFASEKSESTPSTVDGRGARASLNKGKAREHEFAHFGKALPRAFDVVGEKLDPDILRGCRRVVVIGIHGWFPGAIMRTVLGEPTGTSQKFVNMMVQALEEFQTEHDVRLEKITKIPLEGEGTIDSRVEKLYSTLKAKADWMDDIHAADAILVATHSQGSVVSTHLLDCLIRDQHIRTTYNTVVEAAAEALPTAGLNPATSPRPQRVCCLALCGIHLGPLRYLSTSTLLQPYLQYFESIAARELFEFQNTESEVSKKYVAALQRVVGNGTKMVYVASLNDQVVPIYSGLFTAVSHPLILRALYIDGDAYHSSDFLSNLLVLLLRILNSGISDSGLLAHLSEATAGSLNGVGHSTAYEELATYSLAVKYLFLTNEGLANHPDLVLEPFNANTEQNDYEIPWSLRDIIADERVAHYFSQEITQLRDAFRDWQPRTTILRDLKRKLQPIQRLPSSFTSSSTSSSRL